MKLFTTILLLIITANVIARSAEYLPVPSRNFVRHNYYFLSYNEKYGQANWVYYALTDSMVLKSREERGNRFKMDKMIPSGSAKSADYSNSGYDRGHLCPAADMSFSKKAMEESFLMSNISPQTPDFNRGIWKELESKVRSWAKKEHKITVVTGPVFKNLKGTIGQDHIAVPGYYFKIIYDETDEPKLIAFVLPNAKSDRRLTDFAVTTDSVEKLTGFDFFSQLPDGLEAKLESQVELTGWFEGYSPEVPIGKRTHAQPENDKGDFYFYMGLLSVVIVIVLFVTLKNRIRRN